MVISQPVFAKIVFLKNRGANDSIVIKCLLAPPYNLSIVTARDATKLTNWYIKNGKVPKFR